MFLFRRRLLLDVAVMFLVIGANAAVVAGQERPTATPDGPRVRVVCSLFVVRSVGSAKAADAMPLAPGTLVPLDAALSQSSADVRDLAASLKGRFGLDSIEEVAVSGTDLAPDSERTMASRAGGLEVRVTVVGGEDPTRARVRIRLLRGDALIAEARPTIEYGHRAVVSTGEGEDAGFVIVGVERFVPTAPRAAVTAGEPPYTPPTRIRHVPPKYPAEAQRKRIQGLVTIRCTIGVDGVPTDLVVFRSVPGLDEAALAAVSQWRWTPARDSTGTPVPVTTTVTVNFSLQ